VSTPTPQDSPSKRTAKAETPKSHKIAHSKTRTPGSSPYRSKRETDPHRISQREKQLSMGKNTVGYQLYTAAIARCVCSFFFFFILLIERDARSTVDPRTPDAYQVCSKRSWDGQVSKWRRMLHQWDPNGEPEPEFDVEMSEVSESQFESSERSVHEEHEHEEHDAGKQ
jgi:histone RNA hairpin-binding protein